PQWVLWALGVWLSQMGFHLVWVPCCKRSRWMRKPFQLPKGSNFSGICVVSCEGMFIFRGDKYSNMLVEVCANSLQSALNAQMAGADRIELCSELGVGGITPSVGLIQSVKKELSIPIHVLIRPRSGHFTYSDSEFEVMKADILACSELGVDGIVAGILMDDFSVDVERNQELLKLAEPMHFTFHRAFDWVLDPVDALKQLERMGIGTVLTS